MKQKPRKLTWLLLALVLLLALSACERPAPREEVPAPGAGEGEQLPTPAIVIPTTAPLQPDPGTGYPPPIDGGEAAPEGGEQPAGEQPAEGEAAPENPDSNAPQQPETPADGGGDAAAEPPTNAQGEQIHIVQQGDNLYQIGLRYGISYEELGLYNGIPAPYYIIYPGDEIRIPPTQ